MVRVTRGSSKRRTRKFRCVYGLSALQGFRCVSVSVNLAIHNEEHPYLETTSEGPQNVGKSSVGPLVAVGALMLPLLADRFATGGPRSTRLTGCSNAVQSFCVRWGNIGMRLDSRHPITRTNITLWRQGRQARSSAHVDLWIYPGLEGGNSVGVSGGVNEKATVLALTMNASEAKNVNRTFGRALIGPNEVPSRHEGLLNDRLVRFPENMDLGHTFVLASAADKGTTASDSAISPKRNNGADIPRSFAYSSLCSANRPNSCCSSPILTRPSIRLMVVGILLDIPTFRSTDLAVPTLTGYGIQCVVMVDYRTFAGF